MNELYSTIDRVLALTEVYEMSCLTCFHQASVMTETVARQLVTAHRILNEGHDAFVMYRPSSKVVYRPSKGIN